jgi:erythromycin esterase
MRFSRALLCCLISSAFATVLAHAQQPANLGFETHDGTGRAAGWNSSGSGFQIVVDSSAPFAGRFSLRTRWVESGAYTEASGKFAVASQVFPLARAAGRKLRLTGYIRTEDISSGWAGFWMRVDGPSGSIAFDNMQQRGPRGSTSWTRYNIELPVDSGATMVLVGVLHPGSGTAWFDSLTFEVVGDPMPRTVASFRPTPRPAEDLTRLLSDAELALPRDSVEVAEDAAYAAWIRANVRPIRSLGAIDFSDLRFFAPLLRDKRIVQLGESGHGVAEFSMAKVRLIKYLHEELGFDVMAFESSTYECNRAQRNVATLSAVELMRACIFGVWHVQEALPLFEYIKQTHNTDRPLILAGFDNQTSSFSVRARPGVLRDLIAPLDTAYARHVYRTDSVFLASRGPDYARANETRLVAFYDSLAGFLRRNQRALETAHPDDRALALVARQAALSMNPYVRQLAAGPAMGTEIRDRAMADNLDFLLTELHPGKKVIVWAHNFHIQHREHTTRSESAPRTMGVYVAERHRRELYTIGLFMYRGSAAQNNRSPYPVAPMRSGTLESILHRAPWRYSFVDFSQARQTRGNEWMWKRITGMAWGTNPEQFVPRDEYDGVLFIDTSHVPTYLR